MSNIFALDTSSPVLSVALQKGEDPIRESTLEGFLSHAENLLPMMHDLLKQEGLQIHDIDSFLIGRGPGSFTGLRIGFATLKAICALKPVSCFGAESLDMIAGGIETQKASELAVCLDARREKIYVKRFQNQDGQWESIEDAEVLSVDQTVRKLSPGTLITGDALDRYQDQFLKRSKNISFLSREQWYPRASLLIRWFRQGRAGLLSQLEEPIDFVPLYYRRSEAEEKKKDVRHH